MTCILGVVADSEWAFVKYIIDRMDDSEHFCHTEVTPCHSFLETSLVFVLISEINDQEFQTMTVHNENTHNVLC